MDHVRDNQRHQKTQPAGETRLYLSGVHKSVTARGADVHILRGVDLSARAGQVTAVLGPNGAGKTTTLTIAQGLDRPDEGTVELLGTDPWHAGATLRSQVGVMLQDGGLPQSITPARLLKHVSSLYRRPADLDELIGRLGIHDILRRDIRRLSGGQRQRVALAAALIGRPQVVFLDEPSAGLDPVSRQLVFDLVLELKEAGVAIVLTTHLLDDAQRLADHVVLLRHGVVERSGSVAELTATGAPALVFVLDRRLPAEALASLPTGLSLTEADPGVAGAGVAPGRTYRVEGATDAEALARLAGWWRDAGLMPLDLRMVTRTLEDVFLEVAR